MWIWTRFIVCSLRNPLETRYLYSRAINASHASRCACRGCVPCACASRPPHPARAARGCMHAFREACAALNSAERVERGARRAVVRAAPLFTLRLYLYSQPAARKTASSIPTSPCLHNKQLQDGVWVAHFWPGGLVALPAVRPLSCGPRGSPDEARGPALDRGDVEQWLAAGAHGP